MGDKLLRSKPFRLSRPVYKREILALFQLRAVGFRAAVGALPQNPPALKPASPTLTAATGEPQGDEVHSTFCLGTAPRCARAQHFWQELLWKRSNSKSSLDLGRACHQPATRCCELCLVSCLVVYCSASQLEFCVLTPPNHGKRFAHVLAMTWQCFFFLALKSKRWETASFSTSIITHLELAFTLR